LQEFEFRVLLLIGTVTSSSVKLAGTNIMDPRSAWNQRFLQPATCNLQLDAEHCHTSRLVLQFSPA
jgi:hypothetical protein